MAKDQKESAQANLLYDESKIDNLLTTYARSANLHGGNKIEVYGQINTNPKNKDQQGLDGSDGVGATVKKDLDEGKVIMLPLHRGTEQDGHVTAAVIYKDKVTAATKILYMDSLSSPEGAKQDIAFLQELTDNAPVTQLNIPRQPDVVSCGVIAVDCLQQLMTTAGKLPQMSAQAIQKFMDEHTSSHDYGNQVVTQRLRDEQSRLATESLKQQQEHKQKRAQLNVKHGRQLQQHDRKYEQKREDLRAKHAKAPASNHMTGESQYKQAKSYNKDEIKLLLANSSASKDFKVHDLNKITGGTIKLTDKKTQLPLAVLIGEDSTSPAVAHIFKDKHGTLQAVLLNPSCQADATDRQQLDQALKVQDGIEALQKIIGADNIITPKIEQQFANTKDRNVALAEYANIAINKVSYAGLDKGGIEAELNKAIGSRLEETELRKLHYQQQQISKEAAALNQEAAKAKTDLTESQNKESTSLSKKHEQQRQTLSKQQVAEQKITQQAWAPLTKLQTQLSKAKTAKQQALSELDSKQQRQQQEIKQAFTQKYSDSNRKIEAAYEQQRLTVNTKLSADLKDLREKQRQPGYRVKLNKKATSYSAAELKSLVAASNNIPVHDIEHKDIQAQVDKLKDGEKLIIALNSNSLNPATAVIFKSGHKLSAAYISSNSDEQSTQRDIAKLTEVVAKQGIITMPTERQAEIKDRKTALVAYTRQVAASSIVEIEAAKANFVNSKFHELNKELKDQPKLQELAYKQREELKLITTADKKIHRLDNEQIAKIEQATNKIGQEERAVLTKSDDKYRQEQTAIAAKHDQVINKLEHGKQQEQQKLFEVKQGKNTSRQQVSQEQTQPQVQAKQQSVPPQQFQQQRPYTMSYGLPRQQPGMVTPPSQTVYGVRQSIALYSGQSININGSTFKILTEAEVKNPAAKKGQVFALRPGINQIGNVQFHLGYQTVPYQQPQWQQQNFQQQQINDLQQQLAKTQQELQALKTGQQEPQAQQQNRQTAQEQQQTQSQGSQSVQSVVADNSKIQPQSQQQGVSGNQQQNVQQQKELKLTQEFINKVATELVSNLPEIEVTEIKKLMKQGIDNDEIVDKIRTQKKEQIQQRVANVIDYLTQELQEAQKKGTLAQYQPETLQTLIKGEQQEARGQSTGTTTGATAQSVQQQNRTNLQNIEPKAAQTQVTEQPVVDSNKNQQPSSSMQGPSSTGTNAQAGTYSNEQKVVELQVESQDQAKASQPQTTINVAELQQQGQPLTSNLRQEQPSQNIQQKSQEQAATAQNIGTAGGTTKQTVTQSTAQQSAQGQTQIQQRQELQQNAQPQQVQQPQAQLQPQSAVGTRIARLQGQETDLREQLGSNPRSSDLNKQLQQTQKQLTAQQNSPDQLTETKKGFWDRHPTAKKWAKIAAVAVAVAAVVVAVGIATAGAGVPGALILGGIGGGAYLKKNYKGWAEQAARENKELNTIRQEEVLWRKEKELELAKSLAYDPPQQEQRRGQQVSQEQQLEQTQAKVVSQQQPVNVSELNKEQLQQTKQNELQQQLQETERYKLEQKEKEDKQKSEEPQIKGILDILDVKTLNAWEERAREAHKKAYLQSQPKNSIAGVPLPQQEKQKILQQQQEEKSKALSEQKVLYEKQVKQEIDQTPKLKELSAVEKQQIIQKSWQKAEKEQKAQQLQNKNYTDGMRNVFENKSLTQEHAPSQLSPQVGVGQGQTQEQNKNQSQNQEQNRNRSKSQGHKNQGPGF